MPLPADPTAPAGAVAPAEERAGYRLLDVCCCQGGATRGYQLEGWHVTGVDNEPQPRYIGDSFIQADGLEVLADRAFMSQFDAVHMSWPCQGYTGCQRIRKRSHPKLIDRGRDLVTALGLPYISENVVGAPLRDPILLCGTMFGLHTYRHRLFESNVALAAPPHPPHPRRSVKMGRSLAPGDFYHAVGNFSSVGYVRDDMGVPWMNRDGIRESIPAAYTRLIGGQLMAYVDGARRGNLNAAAH